MSNSRNYQSGAQTSANSVRRTTKALALQARAQAQVQAQIQAQAQAMQTYAQVQPRRPYHTLLPLRGNYQYQPVTNRYNAPVHSIRARRENLRDGRANASPQAWRNKQREQEQRYRWREQDRKKIYGIPRVGRPAPGARRLKQPAWIS